MQPSAERGGGEQQPDLLDVGVDNDAFAWSGGRPAQTNNLVHNMYHHTQAAQFVKKLPGERTSFALQSRGSIAEDMQDMWKRVNQAEGNKESWEAYRDSILDNAESLHCLIEQKKEELMALVEERAVELHAKVGELTKPRLKQASDNIMQLSEVINDMVTLSREVTREADKDMTKGDANILQEVSALCFHPMNDINMETRQKVREHATSPVPLPPRAWKTILLKSRVKKDVISSILGPLQHNELFEFASLLDEGRVLKTFNVKLESDMRDCGIIDLTITDDEEFIVVDVQNKAVKLFKRSGTFVRDIGKKWLRHPTNVAVGKVEGDDVIFVSDQHLSAVKAFMKSGEHQGTFAKDVVKPSSLASVKDQMLVLDGEDRTIYAYDMKGIKMGCIRTKLATPASITAPGNNTIIVSDWLQDALHMYDLKGNQLHEVKGHGMGEDLFDKPVTVQADIFGNILVADKNNRRIKVYNENLEYQKSPIGRKQNLNTPMAAATLPSSGLLAVAEYHGNIKICSYMRLYDEPISEEYSVDEPPVTARPEQVRVRPRRKGPRQCFLDSEESDDSASTSTNSSTTRV